jgi:hypothetical protein
VPGARAETIVEPATSDEKKALAVLEDELANLEGLSKVMPRMGEGGGDDHLIYLAFRLEEHHQAALDAFETLNAKAEGGA